ncbi:MAG: hypothetical protein IPK60_20500 [Sandaracinaceae bacterium]|nr:hypothetical protein [Sandaracinaceae bacterium]
MKPARASLLRMDARRALEWAAALCVAVPVSFAQGDEREAVLPPERPAPPAAVTATVAQGDKQEPRWSLNESELPLTTLVEMCASGLGLHLEYDRSKLEGRIAVDRPGNFTPRELWDILNRELASRGLATVQPPGHTGFKVVPVADAASTARVEASDLAGALAGYVKLVVGLDHRKPDDLVEALKLVLSKGGGQIMAVREGQALVISDYRPHVDQALRVLALLDLPSAQPATIEVPLRELAPLAMATLLERVVNTRKAILAPLVGTAIALPESSSMLVVAPTREISWWRTTIETFDRPEAVTTLHYTPRRFGLAETARLVEATVRREGQAPSQWRMVEDALTGTLIVTATPKLHAEVQALISRLNDVQEGPRRPLRAFAIRNRRVSEVLGLLEGLLDAGVLEDPNAVEAAKPAEGVQGATAPITRPSTNRPRKGADVTLAADEATNRILAFGEARVLDELARLIAEVDVREAQVLVEALVLSLSESQTRALGVELQAIGSRDGRSWSPGSLFGLGSPSPNATSIPALAAQGATAVVLAPGDFSAVVRALEVLNEGRTLTIPKVLVNNNVQAALDSTLQTPYASTNASSTVATTSFGGTLDAGTQVMVKPQVADGDQIVIEYTVSLSSFVGEASSAELPPPRQENRLSSVVTIPDGFTVVVGGLEVETEGEAESRVPWLGSVPLIGNLFKNQSRTKTKSRFYVFLRCNVMRSSRFEDLKYESSRALDQVGLDDGWPVMEPRVIR